MKFPILQSLVGAASNSSYWQGKNYIGLGPSAHSFNGNTRQWNISNNNKYIESINNGIIPFEKEELSVVQKSNEYIMISLRTIEGINIDKMEESHKKNILHNSERFINSGLMKRMDNYLVLTNEGKLMADGIASALFI
jgi:oxygen-independent coproporphyrinogen-3 oxidase